MFLLLLSSLFLSSLLSVLLPPLLPVLAVCLVFVLVVGLAVSLASVLASVRAMSPTVAAPAVSLVSGIPLNVSQRWRTPSRLACRLLSYSHSLECLLLALHSLECLPPTPLNELKIETHSNFNANYNFENESPLKISPTRREKVGVDKSFKATHKRVSTLR